MKSKEWKKIFDTDYIYIYGAGKTASVFLEDIALESLVWKSKIKGFLVTDRTNNPKKLAGLAVIQADENKNRNIRVLVPHTGIYRDQIHHLLEQLGYRDFVNIAQLRGHDREDEARHNPLHLVGLENYNEKSDVEKAKNYSIRTEVERILAAGNPDFGGIIPYQSLEKIALKGMRPTTYRVRKYAMMDILRSDMEVLDIGCNTGFIDLTIAGLVKSVTGIEYDSSLANAGSFVAKELGISNTNIQNADFNLWYEENYEKKYDVIFSFAIHHWLDLAPDVYVNKLDVLLKKDGYLWIESHDQGGDIDYFKIIDSLKEKGWLQLQDEAIYDEEVAREVGKTGRRFSIMKKLQTVK